VIRLILLDGRTGDAADVVRKALTLGVVLLALAPAAHLAWVAREMPHFGHLHDDSIYFVCAKSLAEGRGYRILSLPAEPYQTKYPPLWPLALAAIWKLDPRFPENLRWGMALAWIMMPAFVALAWRWFRRSGFGPGWTAALCATIALSPCVIVLSAGMMSDLVFSVALLAAILAIESAGPGTWRAIIAGLLAALAYLIKTAALPLALAGPLWLAVQKRYRAAILMFAAMLPAVASWMLWSRAHMSHARDLVSLYYTDYIGYQVLNVTWRDLPVVMWKNLDGVFAGIAELLIFDLANTPFGMQPGPLPGDRRDCGHRALRSPARDDGVPLVRPDVHSDPAGLALPAEQPLPAALVPATAGRPCNGAVESRRRGSPRMAARHVEPHPFIRHRRRTRRHRMPRCGLELARRLPRYSRDHQSASHRARQQLCSVRLDRPTRTRRQLLCLR